MTEEVRSTAAPEPGAPEASDGPLQAPEPAEVVRLQEAVAAAEARAAEATDRLLRLQADFENYRRRVRKDQEESRKFATERLVKELLEVQSNFDRALAETGSPEGFREGVALIARQFRGILEREGVQPIAAEGAPFDPAVHEAIAREPAEGVAAGTVVREFDRGYTLHGKVVRPAKVAVAVTPEAGSQA